MYPKYLILFHQYPKLLQSMIRIGIVMSEHLHFVNSVVILIIHSHLFLLQKFREINAFSSELYCVQCVLFSRNIFQMRVDFSLCLIGYLLDTQKLQLPIQILLETYHTTMPLLSDNWVQYLAPFVSAQYLYCIHILCSLKIHIVRLIYSN